MCSGIIFSKIILSKFCSKVKISMAMPMERLALTSSAFHVTTTNLKKVSHTLIIRHPNLVTRDHLWPFKNVNLLSVWGKESGLVCQAVKQRLPFLLHHQPTLPLLRRISVYSFFFVRSWHWSRCRHPLRLEKNPEFCQLPRLPPRHVQIISGSKFLDHCWANITLHSVTLAPTFICSEGKD